MTRLRRRVNPGAVIDPYPVPTLSRHGTRPVRFLDDVETYQHRRHRCCPARPGPPYRADTLKPLLGGGVDEVAVCSLL